MCPRHNIPLLTFHGAALAPLVADHDGLLVLPLPGDGRLRVASIEQILIPDGWCANDVSAPGLAVEADAGALHGDRVVAGLVVQDVRGLNNLR